MADRNQKGLQWSSSPKPSSPTYAGRSTPDSARRNPLVRPNVVGEIKNENTQSVAQEPYALLVGLMAESNSRIADMTSAIVEMRTEVSTMRKDITELKNETNTNLTDIRRDLISVMNQVNGIQDSVNKSVESVFELRTHVYELDDKVEHIKEDLRADYNVQIEVIKKDIQEHVDQVLNDDHVRLETLQQQLITNLDKCTNRSLAHIDLQVGRVSSDLRAQTTEAQESLEIKFDNKLVDLKAWWMKDGRVLDKEVESKTEATLIKHYDSESDEEIDKKVRIDMSRKFNRNNHNKNSKNPLSFRKSQIMDMRGPGSSGGDSSPDDSDHSSEHSKRRGSKYPGQRDRSHREPYFGTSSLIVKTREDFPELRLSHLDKWHMMEIIDFLDEYERVCERNSQADLKIVHFMDAEVLAIFTATAVDLNMIDPLSTSRAVQRMSDRRTKKVMYEILKAQSLQDFKDRLKVFKFPGSDKGDLVPRTGTFKKVHDTATVYAQKFLRAVTIMSKKAKSNHLIPLRGKGKHGEGMIEIFLKSWPQDCGNSLYSHLKQSSTELDECGTLESLLRKFLEQLRPYKEMKQKTDDLDSILHYKRDMQQSNKFQTQERRYDRDGNNNGYKKPFTQRVNAMDSENQEDVPEEDDSIVIQQQETEYVDQVLNEVASDTNADENEELLEAEKIDKEIALLSAVSGKPMNEVRPCYKMFKDGKCDIKGCIYNHTKAVVEKIALRKIQEILHSPMVNTATKDALRVTEKKLLDGIRPAVGAGAKMLLNRGR